MKKTTLLLSLLFLALSATAQNLPTVKTIKWQDDRRIQFAHVAQFQISIPYEVSERALPVIADPDAHIKKINHCLNMAAKNECQILIFPELSMSLPQKELNKLESIFSKYAQDHDAIIIGGTYYDEERRCHCQVFVPGDTFSSYKIRPSIFESSPLAGKGMIGTDTLVVYKTKYGNFAPLVCVDLISDDANYLIRTLSNRREIEMMFNVNYNPASKEFLREASSIVTRHPLFIMLTNTSEGPGASSERDHDSAYGYSGLLASLSPMQQPTCAAILPDIFKTPSGSLIDGYENLVSVLEPGKEAALIYEVNLNVTRVPENTNAPDQGYPTVRNVSIIDIK